VKLELDNNEEIQLRPLSKGLGFHQKDEVKKSFVAKKNIKSSHQKVRPRPQITQEEISLTGQLRKNELQKTPVFVNLPEKKKVFKEQVKPSNAGNISKPQVQVSNQFLVLHRFLSNIIDLSIIYLSVLLATSLVLLFSFNKILILQGIFSQETLMNIQLPLFLNFFIFYFSFQYKFFTRTIGQRIFNLELLFFKKKVSYVNCFFLSLFKLFNMMFIGLLSLIKLDEFLFQCQTKYES
jgi:hypothetical protein